MAHAADEDARSWRAGAGTAWRQGLRRLRTGPLHRWRFVGRAPERVLLAPPDLRAGDAQVAAEIYHGRFPLAGHVVDTGGGPPFGIRSAPEAWRRSLHGFRWLRHMRAAGTELAAANARALVGDWVEHRGRHIEGPAWEAGTVAKRVIAWLAHSPVVLGGADPAFERRFLRSLGLQTRFLQVMAGETPDGVERLRARAALSFAALCLPASAARLRQATRDLSAELDRQILPDGGHLSRSPAALAELLFDLMPLRQTYAARGEPVPLALLGAVERMLPALRFFRHRDGALARFNGTGATVPERVAAILRHDDSGGAPLFQAPHSGFERLAMGDTLVVADTGTAPPPNLGSEAHAGTLSFEMSSGRDALVVNGGVDRRGASDFRPLARATAAHSTAVLNDTSSARFAPGSSGTVLLVGGPRRVVSRREDGDGFQGFRAEHDGYARRWGLCHERALRLGGNGDLLEGRDSVLPVEGRTAERVGVAVRFHLHPGVELFRDEADALVLAAPGGDRWRFLSPDVVPALEESIFFASPAGPRRSRQIVLAFEAPSLLTVEWSFRRFPSEA